MVDGITVTDPYNSGMAVEIENNAIQELQFISGTFNAEYGQAMSGIVNIVTKDGDFSKYSGSLSGSFGDYYISSNRVSFSNSSYPLFPQVDNLNLDNITDLKGNFEGPIVPGVLSFFVSARKNVNNGYLFGEQIFYPNSYLWSDAQNMFRIDSAVGLGNDDFLLQDSLWSPTDYQDSLFVYIDSLRNNDQFDWVSMNTSDQLTYQAKLSWRVTPTIKFGYNRMFSNTKSQDYSHGYRWNPRGRPFSFNTRTGDIIRTDISINQSTFANIMFSNAVNHYRTHLSSDPDFYKVIENLSFDDSFWGFDTLDPSSASNYNTDPRIFDYATGNNYEVGGNYMDISEAKIPVLDWGFLRSDATYDVVHVWNNRFFQLDEHISRFFASTEKLRMPCSVNREELKKILAGCVKRANFNNSYVEMIQTRGMSPTFDRDPRKSQPRFLAFAIPFGWILDPKKFDTGIDLAISKIKRISPESVDPRVKNYHWLDLVNGMFEAYDRGHYTAVLVDEENNVLEGPGFNIFSLDKNGLKTPKIGVLEGITRQTAIRLASELDIPVQEKSIESEEFINSDEAFATSTAGGIIPITRINGKKINNGKIGKITSLLKNLYWEKHTDPQWSQSVDELI